MGLQDFTSYKAVAKLRSLALKPHDLTAPQGMTAERIAAYVCATGGYELLYASQRVDDQALDALQELADEARLVEGLLAMKRGEVINRIEGYACENRQVLHTACRDVAGDTPVAAEASMQARQQLAKLHRFLADLDSGALTNSQGQPFTTMVQVGIGGSDLGPRALYLALQLKARYEGIPTPVYGLQEVHHLS